MSIHLDGRKTNFTRHTHLLAHVTLLPGFSRLMGVRDRAATAGPARDAGYIAVLACKHPGDTHRRHLRLARGVTFHHD
jgi:hypothetical protein